MRYGRIELRSRPAMPSLMTMKKLLLAGFLSTSLPVLAQIPNGGFESWNTVEQWMDPDGWSTMNQLTYPAGSVLACQPGAPAPEGDAFVKVTTREVPGLGVVPGTLLSGTNQHPGF